MPGDHQALDLAGPLADLIDLDIAPVARHWKFIHEPVATMNLYRLVCRSLRHFRGEKLGNRSLPGIWLPLHMQPGGLVIHVACYLYLHLHIREFELNGLKFTDRLTKLLALARIRQCFIQARLSQTYRESRDRNTSAIQNIHELFKALATLSQNVFFGYFTILKGQGACIRRFPPHLSILGANRVARRSHG